MIARPKNLAVTALAALAVLWSATSAATVTGTWYLNDDNVDPTSGPTHNTKASEVGYSYESSTPDDLTFTISGWFTDNNGGLQDGSADLVHWGGGLGMDRVDDSHGIDNKGTGDDELVAIVFSEKVSLDSFQIGYLSGDSDISILYQTDENAGFDSNTLAGKTVAGLTSGAYSLLGNVLDSPTHTTMDVSTKGGATGDLQTDFTSSGGTTYDFPDLPTTQVFSKVWLVGAYLKNIVGNPDVFSGNDYFKFKKLTASTHMAPPPPPPPGNGVPAPASALLLALGLLQLSRQRKSAQVR